MSLKQYEEQKEILEMQKENMLLKHKLEMEKLEKQIEFFKLRRNRRNIRRKEFKN